MKRVATIIWGILASIGRAVAVFVFLCLIAVFIAVHDTVCVARDRVEDRKRRRKKKRIM